MERKILFLSNGHGEDLIAAAIIEKLLEGPFSLDIRALPLVGEGRSYDGLKIKVLGPRRAMPSGGFIRTNPAYFIRDLRAGWLGMTGKQIRILKKEGNLVDLVVCVGDVFLILLSTLLTRKPIVFLPTAKSNYIGEHYLIEKWLMRRLCKLVITRDKKTASSLSYSGIRAIWVGNVMMDCLRISGQDFGLKVGSYVIGILPGSREEAYGNLKVILKAAAIIHRRMAKGHEFSQDQGVDFLLSLAPSLSLERLGKVAAEGNWTMARGNWDEKKRGIIAYLTSRQGASIEVVQGRFGDVLNCSRLIIGLSGMGNEQAVGLGKPVVSFAGKGPQITRRFLRLQRKLLEGAISIVERRGEAVADEVCSILHHPERLQAMARMGKERMKGFGAAGRVARLIIKELR